MSVLFSILGISLLIVLHELGHYGVAKLCNMRVLRFSLGFGPVIAKLMIGDTQWQIAAVPLGWLRPSRRHGPRKRPMSTRTTSAIIATDPSGCALR